jgi:hypothetical protein
VSPVRPPVKVVGRRLDAEHYRLRDLPTRIRGTARVANLGELGVTV